MKRILTLALVALVAAMPLVAQRHNYGPGPGNRYDYERSGSRWIPTTTARTSTLACALVQLSRT